MSTIANRLDEIRARIKEACAQAGRDPSRVHLLAASKTVSAQQVVEAIEAGQTLFGENRAQELRDKRAAVEALLADRPDLPRPRWHFIGHLQSNKARVLVGRVEMVQSIRNEDLAKVLDARARRLSVPLPVLIEVNIADEPSKSGVGPDDALALARAVHALPHLSLQGLMAIPPAGEPQWFQTVAALAARGREQGLPLHTLSMGMSGDFEAAIRAGADVVRVGRAIFGARQ